MSTARTALLTPLALALVFPVWGSLPFAAAAQRSVTRVSGEVDAGNAELAELRARLAALESQMQTGIPGSYDGHPAVGGYAGDCGPGGCGHSGCAAPHHLCCGGGPDDCGCGCVDWCAICPYNPWTIGGGVYWFEPHWKTNPAFAAAVTVGALTTTVQTDFDYDYDAAPLVWAAYRNPHGIGIQGRAWWYDDSASVSAVNDGTITIQSAAPLGLENTSTTIGDVNTFESSLQIDVADLLLTYMASSDYGSLELATGTRYARIEQAYRTVEVPAVGGLIDSVDARHDFEGVGPTISLEARLHASCRWTAFAIFRYSVLFGRSEQAALEVADNVLVAARFQENDDLLPIAEVELGLEYAVRIACTELYFQAAFVSQVWQGAGNSSNNELILEIVDPEVLDKNADLGLWGFRSELGVRF